MPPIECLLGPADTIVGNDTYSFTRDSRGRFVAEVFNLKHAAILLGLPAYAEVRDEAEASTALTPLVTEEPTPAPIVPAPEPQAPQPAPPASPAPAADVDLSDTTEELEDDDFEGHPEDETDELPEDPDAEGLVGSGILPDVISITPELTISLGDLVRRSHVDSTLSVDDWNALETADRENRLVATINVLQKEHQPEEAPEEQPTPADPNAPTPTPPAPPVPDDLAVLKGIGKPSAEKLHAAGILTFEQLAALSAEEMAALDEQLELGKMSSRFGWVAAAQAHIDANKK